MGNCDKRENSGKCNPMCSSKKCFCKEVECDYLHKQYGLKKWVFRLIVITLSLGIMVPFASEAILSVFFPGVTLGLSTWNQFVGIVLGIIATVLSIVSIIMGFKNYDDTLSVQKKYMEALNQVGNIAADLTQVKDDVKRMSSVKEPITVEVAQTKEPWDKEPKDKA